MLFENLQMLFGHLKPIPKFREHAVPRSRLDAERPLINSARGTRLRRTDQLKFAF
jgi:hypothetical protein